jgi:RecA/RadA recombinase
MADERGKAIELAVSQIEKQFGKGSIVRLGSKEALRPHRRYLHWINFSFDAALGVGGSSSRSRQWRCSGLNRRVKRLSRYRS